MTVSAIARKSLHDYDTRRQ